MCSAAAIEKKVNEKSSKAGKKRTRKKWPQHVRMMAAMGIAPPARPPFIIISDGHLVQTDRDRPHRTHDRRMRKKKSFEIEK